VKRPPPNHPVWRNPRAPADEAYWTRKVIGLALELGLLAHWHPDSRRAVGAAGFPDVVAVGPGGALFAEIKMPDGDTSAEQDLWAWTLSNAGLPWFQWTVPADFDSGRIEYQLRCLL
jgi:hypothetical protein